MMPEVTMNGEAKNDTNDHEEPQQKQEEDSEEVDVHFEPIVNLPLIDVSNNEEDEIEMIKLRAKLYRYDSMNEPPEWKERGTGDVKLLRHKTKHTVRVVMRRDKTLKICANHFVTPWMELKPNCGSDRAWVWSVLADYADEQLKPELLAIRFANAENASLWKETFEKAKKIVGTECAIYSGKRDDNEEEEEEQEDDSDSETCSTHSQDSSGSKGAEGATEEGQLDCANDQVAEEITNNLKQLDVKDQGDKEKQIE